MVRPPVSTPFENLFKLRKPCANCPFLKSGAIELRLGRMAGIIENLVDNDHSTFFCHKTVSRADDQHSDTGEYLPIGTESMCVGAMVYLEKIGRPTVDMRLARRVGLYSSDRIEAHFPQVIDPAN